MTRLNGSKWIRPKRRAYIYARDGGACVVCGATRRLTLDHIEAQCRTRDHSSTNLVTLCLSCNSSKRNTLGAWLMGLSRPARARYLGAARRASLVHLAEVMLG